MGGRLPLVAVALACLALVRGAAAGVYAPPPADQFPAWLPDNGSIAYLAGGDESSLHVTATDGSSDRRVVSLGRFSRFAISPDGTRIAHTGFDGSYHLFVSEQGARRNLSPALAQSQPAWSPDGTRIAFGRGDGLAVADAASGAVSLVAPGLFGTPSWSPDGRLIAFSGSSGVLVVTPDGRSIKTLLESADCCFGSAVWSPDGTRLAVVESAVGASRLHLVRGDGAGGDVLPLRRPDAPENEIANEPAVWVLGGTALVYSARSDDLFALYRLDLATGSITRLLTLRPPGVLMLVGVFGGQVTASPDGTRVAFVHGGECRDRVGVYVVRVDGRGLRRLTNSCRIAGTARADRLRGTPLADVLAGLGGNDTLTGSAPAGYVGDTLEGGAGDDLLVGTWRQDALDGGPGRDRLLGGASADLAVGGPGADAIEAQGGVDVVDAYDGFADTVSCGTNASRTTPERDTAYVDPLDRVGRDCEVVHRRKRLS